tara:strand:+ start:2922 stop:4580 length:1659 start_codon:yes stop_codon:yes gene_type:complete
MFKIKLRELSNQIYLSIKGQSMKLNLILLFSGLSLGVLELIFGVSLYNFLKYYNLVFEGKQNTLASFFLGRNPTSEIIFFGVLLYFVKFLITLLPLLISQEFVKKHTNELSQRVFENYKEVSKLSLSECNHIMSNVIRQSCLFQSSVFLLISSLLSSLIIFSALFFISIKLTFFVLILVISSGFFFKFIKDKNKYFIDQLYKNNKNFIEKFTLNFQNLIFLKIIGYNEQISQSIKEINNKIKAFHSKHSFFHSINSVIPSVIGLLLIIIIITSNKYLYNLKPLEVIPFIYLLTRVSSSLSQISDNVSAILYTFPYFKELSEQKDYNNEEVNLNKFDTINLDKKKFRLSVENLSVGRDSVLLENINFTLLSNELLIIKGESGKGKSTFLNTLLGIIPKKSGIINWMGHEIERFSPKLLRNIIAFSGSEPYLVKGNIKENIFLGNSNKIDSFEINKAINCSESNFIMNFKEGLETILYESGQGLSAGQKQRISILRALLLKPKLLIFDEATSNIDVTTEIKIIKKIIKNYKNISLLVITHRNSLDKYATNIIKF